MEAEQIAVLQDRLRTVKEQIHAIEDYAHDDLQAALILIEDTIKVTAPLIQTAWEEYAVEQETLWTMQAVEAI